jgi:hypothetical protein
MSMNRIPAPVALPTRPGVAAELTPSEVAYAASVATWREGDAALAAQRTALTADVETVAAATLRERRDAVQDAELGQAKSTLALARDYVSFAEARTEGLKAAAEKASANLAKVEGVVVKKLNGAGVSVQSQAAWPANTPAAERTFMQQVHQSAEYASAKTAADAAIAEVAGNRSDIEAGRRRVAEAAAYLQTVAERIAGLGSPAVRNFATVAA